jgi:hypothetical protein
MPASAASGQARANAARHALYAIFISFVISLQMSARAMSFTNANALMLDLPVLCRLILVCFHRQAE